MFSNIYELYVNVEFKLNHFHCKNSTLKHLQVEYRASPHLFVFVSPLYQASVAKCDKQFKNVIFNVKSITNILPKCLVFPQGRAH